MNEYTSWRDLLYLNCKNNKYKKKKKNSMRHTDTCTHGQETVSQKKPSSYRTESTLTGEDVGVSVLLLVVVLVGLLVRPLGIAPRQGLQNRKHSQILHQPFKTVRLTFKPLVCIVFCLPYIRHFLCYIQ